jgi:hypothetical protein
MDWVIDSSIALAWALPDEKSKEAERFLSRILVGNIADGTTSKEIDRGREDTFDRALSKASYPNRYDA